MDSVLVLVLWPLSAIVSYFAGALSYHLIRVLLVGKPVYKASPAVLAAMRERQAKAAADADARRMASAYLSGLKLDAGEYAVDEKGNARKGA